MTVGLSVLLVAACGQGTSRQLLVESFVTANTDVTTDQAGCVVDRLLEERDLAAIEGELSSGVVTPEFEEDQFRAMFACGIEGDVGEQITDQLINNGVAPSDAPCVSDELVGQLSDDDIDVLLSGEITEQFYTKFFDAMERCDAID